MKKSLALWAFFLYNTTVDVAKKCEVAETPEGVVMKTVISGNSHGASLLKNRRKENNHGE